MVSIWKRVSCLGIAGDMYENINDAKNREVILTNRINFVFFLIMLINSSLELYYLATGQEDINIINVRVFLVLVISICNILIALNGYHNLVKFVLSFLIPFFLIILPVLTDHFVTEFIIWYPFLSVILGIVPVMVYNVEHDKYPMWAGIIYTFLLTVFIDIIVIHSRSVDNTIWEHIGVGYPFAKIAEIFGFIFIVSSTYYLKRSNHQNENHLNAINQKLEEKNRTISEQWELLQSQNIQLKDQHKELASTNEELHTTNEKLSLQKKHLEETLIQLQETQSQLIQSEKMASLGVLTAGVAHEINNPVNYINSGMYGLQVNMKVVEEFVHICDMRCVAKERGVDSAKEESKKLRTAMDNMAQMMSSIKIGVDRTVEIVKSLRTFTRIHEDKKSLVNIHEGIDATLIILYNQYKHRINIQKNYGELPLVLCYPAKLNQVYMNFITNAIQAIPDKGNIEITTSILKGILYITIVDDGIGISEHIQSKIFDPFYTTKEIGKGTGLGLSIAYNIIKEHNGDIKLESAPGKGTKFIIKFPVPEAE